MYTNSKQPTTARSQSICPCVATRLTLSGNLSLSARSLSSPYTRQFESTASLDFFHLRANTTCAMSSVAYDQWHGDVNMCKDAKISWEYTHTKIFCFLYHTLLADKTCYTVKHCSRSCQKWLLVFSFQLVPLLYAKERVYGSKYFT